MQHFVCFVNFSFLLRRVFRGFRYTRQLLDFSVAGRPLRPATDRRLGEPLPHQLANQISAAPGA